MVGEHKGGRFIKTLKFEIVFYNNCGNSGKPKVAELVILLIYACKLLSSYGNEAEMPVRIFLLFAFRYLSRAYC